jgi:hypothetical protein
LNSLYNHVKVKLHCSIKLPTLFCNDHKHSAYGPSIKQGTGMTNKSPEVQKEETSAPRWGAIFAISFGVATMVTAELLPSLLPRNAEGLQITEGAAGQSTAATAVVALVSSLLMTAVPRVAFAICQPEDVDVNEIVFRPTAQEV